MTQKHPILPNELRNKFQIAENELPNVHISPQNDAQSDTFAPQAIPSPSGRGSAPRAGVRAESENELRPGVQRLGCSGVPSGRSTRPEVKVEAPRPPRGKARSGRGQSRSCGIHPADRCPGARRARDITCRTKKGRFYQTNPILNLTRPKTAQKGAFYAQNDAQGDTFAPQAIPSPSGRGVGAHAPG